MPTPADEFRAARRVLGWDCLTMARALRLAGTDDKLVARINEMESGRREISGPVQVAVEALLSGWRPSGWTDTSAGPRA